MSGRQSAGKGKKCPCRWERDGAGLLAFRECSRHYVERVTPPDSQHQDPPC